MAIGRSPAIVVKEVKNTGLKRNIALRKANDLVDDPGLFLLSKLNYQCRGK